MKIMVVRPPGGAFLYITRGFINAFKSIGCDARFWNGNDREIKEFKPDLYIGCSGHRQIVPRELRNKVKIAIHVNPYSNQKLKPVAGTNVNEPDHAIRWTISQKPNVVFGYGHEKDRRFWHLWEDRERIPWIPTPTAADHTLYYPENKEREYDAAFFGGRWPYKAHNIDKWLIPVIKELGSKFAIAGWGGWDGFNSYKGSIPDNDPGRTFLSRAKVGPCICEPHTSVYGIDIPERVFKVILCGVMPVMDKVAGFDKVINGVPTADDPAEYKRLVIEHANDFNRDKVNYLIMQILQSHTYLHRMRNICKATGFEEVVSMFDDKIDEVKKSPRYIA